LIKAILGTTWGDKSSSRYKLGVRNTKNTKQMKREGVPRGSTRVGKVSKPLPRVTTLLVHVSTGGPHIDVDI
jgi:hypothetical protein